MKKLSLEAIETARQLFISDVSEVFLTYLAENPKVASDRAKKAMKVAAIFHEEVEKNQAVNFGVSLGSGVDAAIKPVINAVDNQAANSFDMFSTLIPIHAQKYKKFPCVPGSTTCFYDEVDYRDHAYPEWMVCKTKDASGVIYGWSTENLTYVETTGYWKSNDPEAKFVHLWLEDCLVESKQSLISTYLPF